MSTASFRSWRRSVECWVRLHWWGSPEAGLHIRLCCTLALQRNLDTRYTMLQWVALSTTEALDAIENLILKGTNQAVTWTTFFSSQQAHDGSVAEFFLQCSQLATNCKFQCPHCHGDLSEYMLLRKLMGGLSDKVLKREVFQMYDQFKSVDALRTFCITHEAAARDAVRVVPYTSHSHDTTEVAGVLPDVGAVAGALLPIARTTTNAIQRPNPRPYTPAKTPCGNCGTLHTPGRAQCPARSLKCYKCGTPGHIRQMCRSGRRRSATPHLQGVAAPMYEETAETVHMSGAVQVAGTSPCPQPTLQVTVTSDRRKRVTCTVMAVADTGAQESVGGKELLTALLLQLAQLKRRAGLRDVADMPLQLLGSAVCTVTHGGRSTRQEVCFVSSARHLYLSLTACVELGLVPRSFPNNLQVAAGVAHMLPVCQPGLMNILPTGPTVVPLPPLKENVDRLEEWLCRHSSLTTFNVDRCPLPVMEGEPH
ncbi:hypothetical protein Pcinc_007352 [Petrolisthes cinctipes]|uniref:CCHC-type domain-containing protein n=1 Tax=Petrolisthes cinctipes TaxID=88211 RepID=A0AAE1G9I4_PETCI|nr:hypothetical protein Pcinc_007352 [Petrolisthes cinctipes]